MNLPGTDQQQRIFLWIIPRTCSTVLSKCLSFVDDVQVWMEPYMSCNLNDTLYNPDFGKDNVGHKFLTDKVKEFESSEKVIALRKEMKNVLVSLPGVIDQKEISWPWVKEQLEKPDPGKKFIFIKDQSKAIFYHLEFLPEVPSRHTFLIRHPREVFSSWREMMRDRFQMTNSEFDQYKFADISALISPTDSFQVHHKLWKHLGENSEETPIVIDAYDVLTKPEVILPKYFEKLGVPFKKSYLHWDPSDDISHKWKGTGDMVLLETKTKIYSRAANSTKFDHPQRGRGTPSNLEWKLTPEIEGYIDAALPFYEEMYQHRLC